MQLKSTLKQLAVYIEKTDHIELKFNCDYDAFVN